MTHENNIAELLSGVIAPNNNNLVEDVLGVGFAPEPGQVREISADEIAQIQAAEAVVEQAEAAAANKKEIVLDLDVEPPLLFAYWDGIAWKVEIKDGEGPRFLDPRKRNLLHRALNMAIRRFERKRQFQHRVSSKRPASVERKEIEDALEASRQAGTLDPWPPVKG